ncbi:MAG: DNA primase [Propionibacteriaceae bacterium]
MAGLINEEDIAEVRDRARIDDVVSSYVSLKPAGGGSLKGLCPFHDEKTPSFQVTPSRGFYYCFGCGESGDVIGFVRKINNLSFAESVEHLADKYGVQLRYSEVAGEREPAGSRLRILEANSAAAEFYSEQLLTPDAVIARQFADGRGFGRETCEKFSLGFAPTSGRALGAHLRGRGFREEELIGAGLMRTGGWDFFQGRAVWPIKDAGGMVLGFGARKLFDDDRMPAKYLNTPETPVYKKSHVLYGLDLARTNIGKKGQAVIVEGYTDVMAAHVSGVDTAVASCGTAFGDDHARMIQRLLGGDAFHGEVVFTFDGDAAGLKAALKVFSGDHHFAAQTYVAVEPTGLDPCDLRLQQGDAAVRELVARRQPLYRFVMGNVIGQYDLDRVDGRLGALRAAAPLVGSIRDNSLVSGYIRELATMLGTDVEEVRKEVSRASGRRQQEQRTQPLTVTPPAEDDAQGALVSYELPDPANRALTVERDTLKLVLQHPEAFDARWYGATTGDYSHPAYGALFAAITPLSPAGVPSTEWSRKVVESLDDEVLTQLAVQLSVEPHPIAVTRQYALEYMSKLRLLKVMHTITTLKSKLQRTNPVTDEPAYNQMFTTMIALEAQRKELLLQSTGEGAGL